MRTVDIFLRKLMTSAMVVAVSALLAACSTGTSGRTTTNTPGTSPTTSAMSATPGMKEPMPSGDGLSSSQSGFTLVPATTTIAADTPDTFTFRITNPQGAPVTHFVPEQTRLMHVYVIRSDLTGFAHLHPMMAADGTWTVSLPAMLPGDWRAYTQFTVTYPSDVALPLVLSVALFVPGLATTQPIAAPSNTATVDGYTITLSGQPTAGHDSPLTFVFSQDGQPVTDLQPYLDAYAHVTAIEAGTLAFTHIHAQNPVNGDHGGPNLAVEADFPASGDWRLFIQFQTAGTLHTAEMTVHV